MKSHGKFSVSVHIPKTAGTSVAEIFSRCFHRRVIYDYDGYNSPFQASPLVKDHVDFIQNYFVVLHGHFYASKYFEVFPDAAFISTVRHPVERVISQFMHEFNERSGDALFHTAIQNGQLDVVEFAAQPGVGDAQHRHLSGRPLKDYDLLLVSEDLHKSLAVFSAMVRRLDLQDHFGVPPVLPRANQGFARSNRFNFDEKTKAAIYDRTQADNELYAEALSLLHEKAKTLNL